jgi:hypothetical protein
MGQEWHGTSRQLTIHFFLWKRSENHNLEAGIFAHKGILTAVKEGRACFIGRYI